jgi:AAA domain
MNRGKADAPHPCIGCGRGTIIFTRRANGDEYAECMDCWIKSTRDTAFRDRQDQPAAHPAEAVSLADQFEAKLLGVDQLLELPVPEPLIDGILYRDTMAVLFGMPGSAKTFLALDWALRVAAGSAWLGGFGVHQGPVLYVAAEGRHGIGQRVRAWLDARDLKRPSGFRLYPDVVNLLHPGHVDTVCAWAAETRPVLVVFDTLARAIPGADENSARDMGVAVGAVDRIRAAAGSTVLLVHHTGKDGMDARGSSALRGGGRHHGQGRERGRPGQGDLREGEGRRGVPAAAVAAGAGRAGRRFQLHPA